LLYQVRQRRVIADEIAVPVRFLLQRQRNSEVMMPEVAMVDLRQKRSG
jgi:NADH dehydrogenase FAD-containing subunit